MRPSDQYKAFIPSTLIHTGNDDFFTFIDNMLFGFNSVYDSFVEALPLMAVIQSEDNWIDMIGAWVGLKRPNVAFRELADGEVLFQDIDEPTSPAFNLLHSLSTDNPGAGDVTGTFFPSILNPTETLMSDAQYIDLLIAFQSLKFNGDTLPNVTNVLNVLLSQPYVLTIYNEGVEVRFTADALETFERIVSVQRLFEKISGDGILYILST